MTPEETSLARLLVALPEWRWVPGTRAIGRYTHRPVRVIEFGERQFDDEDAKEADPFLWWHEPQGRDGGPYDGPYVPDLRDPATAGILLGMLSARHEGVHEVTVYDCPPLPGAVVHSGPRGTAKWWTVSGDSLGVAAARALVAIGRCA